MGGMKIKPPGSESVPLVEQRQAFIGMTEAMAKQLPATDPGITICTLTTGTSFRADNMIVDEEISPHVKVRVYTPPNAQEPLPLVLFCHGGGWIFGNLDTEDHLCRVICARVKAVVVSIGYRLAPEHKFPLPIDDCYAAYEWAQKNASRIGADLERCIASGGSAGGGLAIALTHRVVANGKSIAGLVLEAPFALHPDAVPAKYKSLHTSYVDNAGDIPIVTAADCHFAYATAGAGPPYSDHTWFPETGGPEALKGFPPTYIHNTDSEAMRDDGRVLEAELKDAGIAVTRDVQAGYPHYFWIFPIEKGGAAFRNMLINGFAWVLEQGHARGQA